MATVTGGDRLAAAMRELSKKVAKKATLGVGFLEGAVYPDGTSVALVAATQNFGAPARGIPPRPFFSDMVAKGADTWGDMLARILPTVNFDAVAALNLLGQRLQADLRQAITNTNSPPLSEITLMLRKMKSEDQSLVVTGATVGEAARRVAAGESTAGVSTKPLVESGTMQNAVGYEVEG